MLAELVEEAGEETHGGRRSIRGGERKRSRTQEKRFPKAFGGQAKGKRRRSNHARSGQWVPPSLAPIAQGNLGDEVVEVAVNNGSLEGGRKIIISAVIR